MERYFYGTVDQLDQIPMGEFDHIVVNGLNDVFFGEEHCKRVEAHDTKYTVFADGAQVTDILRWEDTHNAIRGVLTTSRVRLIAMFDIRQDVRLMAELNRMTEGVSCIVPGISIALNKDDYTIPSIAMSFGKGNLFIDAKALKDSGTADMFKTINLKKVEEHLHNNDHADYSNAYLKGSVSSFVDGEIVDHGEGVYYIGKDGFVKSQSEIINDLIEREF